MSGLSFICEYSSDSETESDYSVIKRAKLPTPDLSKVPVVLTEAHVDDPSQHGGRTRSFPHVRGNWATYVYVKYSEEDILLKLTEKLEKTLLLQNKSWKRCDDVHISLSKTFTLSYHLIDPFTSNLQNVLKNVERFELEFSGIKAYCNEERTRTFIAVTVDHFCHKNLLSITQKVDEVLSDYKLPKFYEEPSFHISLFWVTGDKRSELNNILHKLNDIVHSYTANSTGLIERVFCKSGNKFFQYSLSGNI